MTRVSLASTASTQALLRYAEWDSRRTQPSSASCSSYHQPSSQSGSHPSHDVNAHAATGDDGLVKFSSYCLEALVVWHQSQGCVTMKTVGWRRLNLAMLAICPFSVLAYFDLQYWRLLPWTTVSKDCSVILKRHQRFFADVLHYGSEYCSFLECLLIEQAMGSEAILLVMKLSSNCHFDADKLSAAAPTFYLGSSYSCLRFWSRCS